MFADNPKSKGRKLRGKFSERSKKGRGRYSDSTKKKFQDPAQQHRISVFQDTVEYLNMEIKPQYLGKRFEKESYLLTFEEIDEKFDELIDLTKLTRHPLRVFVRNKDTLDGAYEVNKVLTNAMELTEKKKALVGNNKVAESNLKKRESEETEKEEEESTTPKILVLNYASKFEPGGGVRSGKTAQEEELYRRTSYCYI